MEQIPNYIMDVEGADSNIFATSYVSDPATGKNFLRFANEVEKKLQFAKMDNESAGYQRMTAGVWMMPDTKYLRQAADGQYYTVQFSKETLKTGLMKYLKSDNANNVNVEHSGQSLEGFVGIEHWIVTSASTKSPIFGFSLKDLGYTADEIPVGTVMKTTYVKDDAFWNDKVLTNEVTGYSIEGLFNLTELEQSFKTQLKKQLFAALEMPLVENSTILMPKEKIGLNFGDLIYKVSYKDGKSEKELANGEYQIEEFGVIIKDGEIQSFGKYIIERTCDITTKTTEEWGDYVETTTETETSTKVREVVVEQTNVTANNVVDIVLVNNEDFNIVNKNKNEMEDKKALETNAVLDNILAEFKSFKEEFKTVQTKLTEAEAKLAENESVIAKQVEKLADQPLKKEEFKTKEVPQSNAGKTKVRIGSKEVYV